jgi:hypothetical protein
MARLITVDASQDRGNSGVGCNRSPGSQQPPEYRAHGGIQCGDAGEMQRRTAACQPEMEPARGIERAGILPRSGQAVLQVPDQNFVEAFLSGDGAKGLGGTVILAVAFRKAVKSHSRGLFAASEQWEQHGQRLCRAAVESDPGRWIARRRVGRLGDAETASSTFASTRWRVTQNCDPSPHLPSVPGYSSPIAGDRLQGLSSITP